MLTVMHTRMRLLEFGTVWQVQYCPVSLCGARVRTHMPTCSALPLGGGIDPCVLYLSVECSATCPHLLLGELQSELPSELQNELPSELQN